MPSNKQKQAHYKKHLVPLIEALNAMFEEQNPKAGVVTMALTAMLLNQFHQIQPDSPICILLGQTFHTLQDAHITHLVKESN